MPRPRRLLPALLLVLAGCAGNTPPQAPGPECMGQIRLSITNDANVLLEVHSAGGAPASPTLLGYVQPLGRQEFVLPRGVSSVYTLANEGGRSVPLPRQFRRLVRFRYDCEPLR